MNYVKTCRVCGLKKHLADYYANPGYKDGRESKCKKCRKEALANANFSREETLKHLMEQEDLISQPHRVHKLLETLQMELIESKNQQIETRKRTKEIEEKIQLLTHLAVIGSTTSIVCQDCGNSDLLCECL